MPLGFFIALLGLLAVTLDTVMGWVWLVLMMPFLIDTSVTLCLRVAAGHAPHVAHRDHAYQRLALRAGHPLPVTLGLLALQAVWQFPLAVTVSTRHYSHRLWYFYPPFQPCCWWCTLVARLRLPQRKLPTLNPLNLAW